MARTDSARYVSDTSQLVWDKTQQSGGYVAVSTPRSNLFTGFVEDRTYALDEVQLKIGKTRLGWATLSMVCLDGPDFTSPGRMLVAASGWTQNSNAQLRELPDNRVTLGSRWGNPPVLCEGIPASITIPVGADRTRCYALDEAGERRGSVSVEADGGSSTIPLSPAYKTLWYEIVVQ
jgi:hypothetical protein